MEHQDLITSVTPGEDLLKTEGPWMWRCQKHSTLQSNEENGRDPSVRKRRTVVLRSSSPDKRFSWCERCDQTFSWRVRQSKKNHLSFLILNLCGFNISRTICLFFPLLPSAYLILLALFFKVNLIEKGIGLSPFIILHISITSVIGTQTDIRQCCKF